jgi:hypothetical protein
METTCLYPRAQLRRAPFLGCTRLALVVAGGGALTQGQETDVREVIGSIVLPKHLWGLRIAKVVCAGGKGNWADAHALGSGKVTTRRLAGSREGGEAFGTERTTRG